MKLIVKWADGKLPFLGILYEGTNHKGGKENEDLINIYKNFNFILHIEFFKRHCNLRVILKSKLDIRYYDHLDYDDIQKLRNWITLTHKQPVFNFGHVELINKQEIVIKTESYNRNFVLKILSIQYAGIENLSSVMKAKDEKDSLEDRIKNRDQFRVIKGDSIG